MRPEIAEAAEATHASILSWAEQCTTWRRARAVNRRVLLVDDEPMIAKAIARMFKARNVPVVLDIASDAEAAIDLAARHAYAVVILDLRLAEGTPGMSVADRLRPSIVLFSGVSKEELDEVREAMRAEVLAVPKNEGIGALVDVVRELLAEPGGAKGDE